MNTSSEKYHEFVAYHKKYTSLEGKAKTKYKSDFCYELDEYHKAYKKLIELFPDAHIPKLSKLKTELEKARTDYAQQSVERKALKKEADRLSRFAQQKRDSQRTLARYMQNEQSAKRKVSLNKKYGRERLVLLAVVRCIVTKKNQNLYIKHFICV